MKKGLKADTFSGFDIKNFFLPVAKIIFNNKTTILFIRRLEKNSTGYAGGIAVFLISHRNATKFYSTNPNGEGCSKELPTFRTRTLDKVRTRNSTLWVDPGSKLTPVKRYVDAALHKKIILGDNSKQSGIYR